VNFGFGISGMSDFRLCYRQSSKYPAQISFDPIFKENSASVKMIVLLVANRKERIFYNADFVRVHPNIRKVFRNP